ncbi:efflux RND transporter permease subunit [Parashewanella spongiae]|uniref:Efflux RND transporter permease subunit n=1 Tax=Parashewanella spongiae TaxID=342950 RepID=A0A3A6U0H0_9GAMM|nr:efflux RND transporter permease subunit [Parashewanella spongiae]MCL1077071.1 efflux RND transporter permease subunit [Parashewanella spongiae]RJY10454.1 efflux RND transporter permease subunit [Parashewanella spongiae]
MIKSFIENGRLAALFIALLIVAGFGALSSLPRTEDPEITNRFATVITTYPGASSERVEALVTDVIENQLRRMEELKLLQSTSRSGVSVIQIELKDSITQTEMVWSRARDLLNDSRALLPNNVHEPRLDDQIGYASTVILGVNWQGKTQERIDIINRYAKELQNRIRLIDGTDFVTLYGAPEEEIQVTLHSNKLAKLRLTPAIVARQLNHADSKISAGKVNNLSFRALIEVNGEFDSLERISSIPIKATQNHQITRLRDIATIKRQPKTPIASKAIVNGKQGVMIAIRMLDSARVDLWQSEVEKDVKQFQQLVPANIKVNWLFEQKSYTSTRLGELLINLLQGFIIILTVLMLTLGLRNALIVALSLPLTALFTLTCMKFVGLPIHQMSVTGLVVALGIMVDNAIVIVDAIGQRRAEGQSKLDAVSNTLKHLWLPLAGSTITTILAFTPIVLMPGASGEFVGGIAISVIFALIGSYLISHTLIAGLAGRFSACNHSNHAWFHNGAQFPQLTRRFQQFLNASLKKPLLTTLSIGLLPLLGFIAASQLTEQFFPSSDRDMFQIEAYLPTQSSIQNSAQLTEKLNSYLTDKNGVTQVNWVVGGNVPSFYYNLTQRQTGAENYAQAMVKTQNYTVANQLIPELQNELDALFPKAQILVRKLEQGPPFHAPVEFRVFGNNLDTLNQIGDQVRQRLSQSQFVTHTRTTLSSGTPKVSIDVNEEASSALGLSLSEIAQQMQMATTGVIGGTLLEQTESLPIRLRIDDIYHSDVQRLSEVNLITPLGQFLPLAAIATTQMQVSRSAIPRRDGKRVNTVEAYIIADVLPAKVLQEVQQDIMAIDLPMGYSIEVGGESAKRNAAVGKLMSSVALVLTLLFTVLVLSFNSFRLTAIILISALQSAGLGLLAVYCFNYPFGFTVIIGLLGLMGLAINAAIVIIAELETEPMARAGESKTIVSLVNSCTRHISSTTVTTIGGFLPLILAGGGFWPPFAVAIAGGTLLTTLISLIWVPSAYFMIMRNKTSSAVIEST